MITENQNVVIKHYVSNLLSSESKVIEFTRMHEEAKEPEVKTFTAYTLLKARESAERDGKAFLDYINSLTVKE